LGIFNDKTKHGFLYLCCPTIVKLIDFTGAQKYQAIQWQFHAEKRRARFPGLFTHLDISNFP